MAASERERKCNAMVVSVSILTSQYDDEDGQRKKKPSGTYLTSEDIIKPKPAYTSFIPYSNTKHTKDLVVIFRVVIIYNHSGTLSGNL